YPSMSEVVSFSFFFSSRRRHTRFSRDWSSDVCSSDLFIFLQPGMRVAVPFGKKKVYTAIVLSKHNQKPSVYTPKDILTIIDEQPIVTTKQLDFWQWIAQYYMCALGDVYKAALPSAFLLESETILSFNSTFVVDLSSLTDDEFLLYQAFEQQPILRFDEVQ